MSETAIIIGTGPAGLTAAYELLIRTDIKPVVIERDTEVGGISKTVVHNGNRIDIGGFRFFSKSDRVIKWWQEILPVQGSDSRDFTDKFENLFLTGRNGMHKYNNQDQSMLTAITEVNNIVSGGKSKDNIWNINTEQDYHEEK